MKPTFIIGLAACLVLLRPAPAPAQVAPQLGDPPMLPKDVTALPRRLSLTSGGFSVNAFSREDVRSFYNAVYATSDGVPMGSTAVTASCLSGTNAPEYGQAVLRRINWFRAMAGVPANVALYSTFSSKDQQAALMMSANTNLSHFPPASWSCYDFDGADAAAKSNLALGLAGPDAVSAYMFDYGANNTEVGHRRWLLYPQTQLMGTGDVPQQASFLAANAVWVIDGHYFDPRPATRTPFVAWPPAGYAPLPVVFPRWSFSFPGANFTNAAVTMCSNGIPIAVALEAPARGIGENTLAWFPAGLDTGSSTTAWPFSGADTVYSIGISNMVVNSAVTNFDYTVTVFDPAVPGADFFPPVISGPAQPLVGQTNVYGFTVISDATGYEWRYIRRLPFSLADGAENGLGNFTADTSPGYSVIASSPVASGTRAFQLAHSQGVSQVLTLNYTLNPRTNTLVQFKSLLATATTDELAKVQVSTNSGGTWLDVFAQAGVGQPGESSFSLKSVCLGGFVGNPLLLRFAYEIKPPGYYYPQIDPTVGWHFDDILITNVEQMLAPVTNQVAETNLQFNPCQAGDYNLQVRAVIFNDFPLEWGPAKPVSAAIGPPVVSIKGLAFTNGQTRISFTQQSGWPSTFKLLYASGLGGSWTVDPAAVLITNVPGSSYSFSTAPAGNARFYQVQAP